MFHLTSCQITLTTFILSWHTWRGLGKPHQDRQCPNQDSNWIPRGYKSNVLQLQPIFSLRFQVLIVVLWRWLFGTWGPPSVW